MSKPDWQDWPELEFDEVGGFLIWGKPLLGLPPSPKLKPLPKEQWPMFRRLAGCFNVLRPIRNPAAVPGLIKMVQWLAEQECEGESPETDCHDPMQQLDLTEYCWPCIARVHVAALDRPGEEGE